MIIKHYPSKRNLQIGLSDAYLALGEYEEAKNILIDSNSVDEDINVIWYKEMLKVLKNIREGKRKKAEYILEEQQRAVPQIYSVKSLCDYGAKLYQMNRIDEAIEFLEFCTNKHDESSEAHLRTGTIYMKEDLYDEAIHHFQRALEIEENCWQANQLLEQMIFNKISIKETV